MSGGGVGGITNSLGGMRTQAVSPTKARPLSGWKKLTWCEAWPGV